MQTRYRFRIKGNLRPDRVFPLNCDPYFIDFQLDHGKIVGLEVFEQTNLNDLPRFVDAPNGTKTLIVKEMHLGRLEGHLKNAENYLSSFGLTDLDTSSYEVKWIPANEYERNLLEICNFSVGFKNQDEYEDATPFDLIARPIIAAFSGNTEYDAAMSFMRKGGNDMIGQYYIDAFYDFYYILETLFAKGKTKNRDIENKFISSRTLISAIEDAKENEKKFLAYLASKQSVRFDYSDASACEIIRHLVKTRGFLHHHNSKHPNAWSPDKQKEFQADAVFIMHVASRLVFQRVMDIIFHEDIIENYRRQLLANKTYKNE